MTGASLAPPPLRHDSRLVSKAHLRRLALQMAGASRITDEAVHRLEEAILAFADRLLESVRDTYVDQLATRAIQRPHDTRRLDLQSHHVERALAIVSPHLAELLKKQEALDGPWQEAPAPQGVNAQNGAPETEQA